eukprot:542533-Rhodomonas_salina.2
MCSASSDTGRSVVQISLEVSPFALTPKRRSASSISEIEGVPALAPASSTKHNSPKTRTSPSFAILPQMANKTEAQ